MRNHPKIYLSCLFNIANIDNELCRRNACASQWLCCETWQTDILADLYTAAWKDLNSCKQHCNQCPICSHVPLVWMPFCHFFHPLPSDCLRTSNPEKRAHLPEEERSKLDFWAHLLTGKLGRAELNRVRRIIMCKECHFAQKAVHQTAGNITNNQLLSRMEQLTRFQSSFYVLI